MKWEWNKKRELAAHMVADDDLPDLKIAAQVGIAERTLETWKLNPVFRARVDEHTAKYRDRILNHGLARREKRVDALEDLYRRHREIIAQRSEDPGMQEVPGGDTGLMCKQVKSVGFGENNTLVEEYVADVGLSREIRGTLQQIAQELGQWTERRDGSGPDNAPPFVVEVVGENPDGNSADAAQEIKS